MNVKQIQANLSLKGFGMLEIDGQAGPMTTAAIKKFQQANGLTVDGKVGPEVLKILLAPSPILRIAAAQFLVSQDGVREKANNSGPEVDQYLASVGLGPGYSWCMAFEYWGFEQARKVMVPEQPNPMFKTGGCIKQLQESSKYVVDTPEPGDVAIIDLGGGAGHTFTVLSVVGSRVYTIEGNTNNNGSANGDGVYFRDRPKARAKAYLRYKNK